uniref:GPI inositol-deacylase PGAP1-like alpha/beta domain-containing protein n=1 Tax=Ditylenchus dipsaci TaxID=166011 RepID=A0A915DFL7_9BILA
MVHPLLFYLCLCGGFLGLCVGEDEFEDDQNQCDMTYMWRHMHFMDVGFGSESSRYSLFLYGEGLYAANFLKNGELTGLPIIFVPGTAGSGRQVRSLGSMLQNKTDLRETAFHFDTFAVDFNEELTAISSEYLVMQSKYLTSAIEYVWSLYTKNHRALFCKISMVISLATPYNEPAYLFDKSILQLWLTLNQKSEQYARSEKPHIPFVSISGGLKDEFIEEEWTISKYHLHASTNSIDRVNLDMDHKCIIWCNQLIRQISRVLFDYAENADTFLKHPAEKLRVHYKGPFALTNTQLFGPEACVPQCPSSGVLSFTTNSTTFGHNFLLALSNDTQTHLVNLICPNGALDCPTVGLSRFLSSDVLYFFLKLSNLSDGSAVKVKLKGTRTWLLTSEVWYGGPLTLRVTVSDGLKILPIHFVHVGVASSVVYKVTVQANSCKTEGIRRMVFFQDDLPSRMSEADGSGNPISITIYESKEGGKEAMLVFIDEFGCNYDIRFQIDYGYTIIKAIRRYRHFIPLSVILTTTVLYIAASTKCILSTIHIMLFFLQLSLSVWVNLVKLSL